MATQEQIDAVIDALPPMQAIPTVAGSPNYSMRTRLDGRNYLLRFIWNQREERWYFDIYDDADALLAASIKVVCNWPLLRSMQWDERLPPGEMMAMDFTGDGSPPGLDELGTDRRVTLMYQPLATVR